MSVQLTWQLAARITCSVLALVALATTPASAQAFLGRIDVTTRDSSGAVVSGARVDVTGPLSFSGVTDQQGEARFLNMPVGTYEVRVTLPGFADYLNESVPVVAGGSAALRPVLVVAGVTEFVVVAEAAPVIDPRKQTTETHVTLDELQNIPSARDPWVVLQTIPSILVDRVNVGGAESGQQSNFMAKGATEFDNTWTLDGVPITDMASLNSSSYFDFDMFQEIHVSTGGAEILSQTPGVQVNLILKSGTNVLHGSARSYFTNESLQQTNLSPALAAAIGGPKEKGNRLDQLSDLGFEVGGPLIEGKWWAWGSFGKTDVRVRTLDDALDRTELTTSSVKTQVQITDTLRSSFTFFRNDKVKRGRDASPIRPDETTWDQSGPNTLYKGEVNWIIGKNLFVTGRGSYMDFGFQLVPRGGLNTDVYLDDARVWHNSFLFVDTNRPQWTGLADANLIRGRHEVKFGFSWRRAVVDQLVQWPGSKQFSIHIGYPLMVVGLTGDQVTSNEGRYTSAYVGDTVSLDRVTLNYGVRFDRSTSSLRESTRPGSPIVPTVLPPLTSPARSNTHVYNTLAPRVSATYALDEERKTLVRGSYSMFASQLGAADSGFVAGPTAYSYVYYFAIDANNDNVTQQSEIDLVTGPIASYGFDLTDPTSTASVNVVSDDLSAPLTHEVLVGVDRELLPEFGLSATLTWRRFNDLRWKPLIGVRSGDFVEAGRVTGTLPDGGTVDVPYFEPGPAAVLPPGNGREDTARKGYHQQYWGFEVDARKRMSDGWMGRVGFSVNDHREYFDDLSRSIEDPTPVARDGLTGTASSPLKNGGLVLTRSQGSGKEDFYFVLPRYQFIANGLVQGPWGINVGANLLIRQGLAQPFYARQGTFDPVAPLKFVLVTPDVGDNRLPTVRSLDLRLSKELRFNGTTVNVDLDWFNVGNESTVLKRQFDITTAAGPTGPGQTLEIMSPRVLRVGLRVSF